MIGLHTFPLIVAALFMFSGGVRGPDASDPEKPAISVQQKTATFTDGVARLLKEKCSPCHFKGGKVFERYPFDQYETVRKLGKRLNTRLKGKDADLVTRWIDIGFPEGKTPLGTTISPRP